MLATPQSLAAVGWRYANGHPQSGGVCGIPFDATAVRGVVSRLEGVGARDVTWIRPNDRDYAAQEITAFLLAWLSAMPAGAVISAPARGAMIGWSSLDARRVVREARAQIRQAARRRRRPGRVEVNVVSGAAVECRSVFAPVTELLSAGLGAADLHATYWVTPSTTKVDLGPWPDIACPSVRRAVLAAFDARPGTRIDAPAATRKLNPHSRPAGRREAMPNTALAPQHGRSAPPTRPEPNARRPSRPSRPRVAVWGRRSDSPTAAVLAELARRGIDNTLLSDIDTTSQPDSGGSAPAVWSEGHPIDVSSYTAFYPRPYEFRGGTALSEWLDDTNALVVNPPSAARTNASKPLQAQLIAPYFACPDTLVTTDIREVRRFLKLHGRVIYKSISGTRSIVAELQCDDPRLGEPLTTPLQVQAWVPGPDLRIHVVGSRAFACRINSDASDYRYAGPVGVEMTEVSEPEVTPKAIELVHSLGMVLGGVDLRRRPDGEWVCFEVNPSPAFTAFDDAHRGAIAHALVDVLTGREPAR